MAAARLTRLACLALAAAAMPGAALAASAPPPEAAKLAPHRAVYNLELASTRASSSVADISGRMVFEFTGNACDGFTQSMRFVMNVSNRDGGSTLSDMRSTTWENPAGDKYKFNFDDYENQKSTSAGWSYSSGAISNTATVGGVAGIRARRAASLHHRGDRAGIQGHHYPGGTAPDHRPSRHSP